MRGGPMANDVRVPEEIAGTSFPCFAIDGSTDPKARTDTERLDAMIQHGWRLETVSDTVCYVLGIGNWEPEIRAYGTTPRRALDAAMDAAR